MSYTMYYRDKIWSYAVLACRAEKFGNTGQLEKYKSEMNKMIEGLSEIMKQEAVK